ncbi:chalcone isomerase family protein [Thiomicrorhabdus sp. 6S2-11]|uniref:Chalcone isomerase family protein n=1 Tax=Thiomicrorhabdus marina TaxID=2818442 RepID=A0ABS3Q3H7_9GAMM|nr:chalcone isomerase family protein [Thiomicrorhabdus marina]MBO1926893.1 chalcone isomerase family protein [Thiomicrorhabdus marina]
MRFLKVLLAALAMILLPQQMVLASLDKDAKIQLDNSVLGLLPERSSATASWLFIDVYRATLFAPSNRSANELLDAQTPLKLKLCYLHKISKDEFIEAASEALPDKLSPALQQAVDGLHSAYQNVQPDDCYQLSYTLQQGVVLSFNSRPVFQSKAAGFKQLYFGIWLGEKPLSDSVKEQLFEPF